MLKAFLRKEDKRNEILKQMKEGKFKGDEIALIKTCLLSDNPFNGIIKYCIVWYISEFFLFSIIGIYNIFFINTTIKKFVFNWKHKR